jgi:hypothetical protein
VLERVGSFAVILGAFVTIVGVPMAAVLLVALLKLHLPYGFSLTKLMAMTTAGAQFGVLGDFGYSKQKNQPPGERMELTGVCSAFGSLSPRCGQAAGIRLSRSREFTIGARP